MIRKRRLKGPGGERRMYIVALIGKTKNRQLEVTHLHMGI
jgi:hypothetical protein